MTDPTSLWPGVLGVSFLVIGIVTYRNDFRARVRNARDAFGLTAFGPVFIAASLAAFAGEHFTAAPVLAQIVPKWLPARLFIAYFVGVAHVAAAVSFVGRRYIRWSAFCLALMFALFVLLMDIPGAVLHPTVRIAWSLAAREATFSIGAIALFAVATRVPRPRRARTIATIARFWTAGVLVFYGLENVVYPQFTPGVPDITRTQAWIPQPHLVAYVTGALLIAFGVMMFVDRYAATAAAASGLLMTLLTVALYVPQWIMAQGATQQVTAINFVFDTLLFAGTTLVISRVIAETTGVDRAAGRALATPETSRTDRHRSLSEVPARRLDTLM